MATIDPEQLFDQADRLLNQPGTGAPRKVDLRRATSNAYYGVFHFLAREAADFLIGKTKRNQAQYRLVYRSLDHSWLRRLCEEAKKPQLPKKFTPYLPVTGLGRNIQAFAAAVEQLQEKRHSADYDPHFQLNKSDAVQAIRTARTAVRRFGRASARRRRTFLVLLLFQPR